MVEKTQSFNRVFKLNLYYLKKKHIGFELAVNINHLTRSLLFQAIYLSSRCKKVKTFQGVYPLNRNQGYEPFVEFTAPRDPYQHFTIEN